MKKPQHRQDSKLEHHWSPWRWPCRATTALLLGQQAMPMSLSLGCMHKKGVRVQLVGAQSPWISPAQSGRGPLHPSPCERGSGALVSAQYRSGGGLVCAGAGSVPTLPGAACRADEVCPVSGSAAPMASLPVQGGQRPISNQEQGERQKQLGSTTCK